MLYLTRQAVVFFLFSAMIFVAGCGGSSSSNQRTVAANHKNGRNSSKSSTTSDNTRDATRKRQGSWNLTSEQVRAITPFVEREAEKNHLPEDLIYGIIWVESRFNPEAVSPVGARGLMQLMPQTADYLAECIEWPTRADSFDPDFNIAAGTYYVSRLIQQFSGDVDLALAAYNAGPTKVRRWMDSTGLPEVSIEYASMVQTARTFFGGNTQSPIAAPNATQDPGQAITDEGLDRLGLAILIAGLSDKQFGLEREDSPNPFGG